MGMENSGLLQEEREEDSQVIWAFLHPPFPQPPRLSWSLSVIFVAELLPLERDCFLCLTFPRRQPQAFPKFSLVELLRPSESRLSLDR